MLRAISLRESWMREIRTSGLTRERAPNGPSLLYRFIKPGLKSTQKSPLTLPSISGLRTNWDKIRNWRRLLREGGLSEKKKARARRMYIGESVCLGANDQAGTR